MGHQAFLKLRHALGKQQELWFPSCTLPLFCPVTLTWPSQLASEGFRWLLGHPAGGDPGRKRGMLGRALFRSPPGGGEPPQAPEGREGGSCSPSLASTGGGRGQGQGQAHVFSCRGLDTQPHSPSSQRLGGCSGVGRPRPQADTPLLFRMELVPGSLEPVKTAMNFAKQL